VTPVAPPSWHGRFKLAIFALLVVNTLVYTARGTPGEALDSIAWYTLLLLFELETARAGWLSTRRSLTAVHTLRLAAAAAILVAAAGYLYERAWLDAMNAWLWIVLVVLLEIEVRYAQPVTRHRARFVGATTAVYSGLAMVALAWAWRGEWFDAYDALLWLTAFATIEMNLLRARPPSARAAPGGA
jgi:hypothetical protein